MSDVRRHNKSVLSRLELGDIVRFERGLFSHYGIYVGNEKVVHLIGNNDLPLLLAISGNDSNQSEILEDNFFAVAKECKAYKANKDNERQRRPLSQAQIVERARSKLGPAEYNVKNKNCEHFVNWCRYGEEISDEVSTAIGLAIGATVTGTSALTSASGLVTVLAYFLGKAFKLGGVKGS